MCAIFSDIARLQLLHDVKKASKPENEYTLIFIC